jgi:hypothetical protein
VPKPALCLLLFAALTSCKPDAKVSDAGPGVAKVASASDAGAAVAPSVPRPAWMKGPVLKLFPRKAAVVALFRNLEETGPLMRAHLARMAGAVGLSAKLEGFFRSLSAGMANPFDRASRERWGLGSQSLAVGLDPEGKLLQVALPVASFSTFERRLKERLAAARKAVFEPVPSPQGNIVVVKSGARALLAYARKQDHVLVVGPSDGSGEPDPAVLRQGIEDLLKVSPEESLYASPSFVASAGRLARADNAVLFFDGDGLFQIATRRAALPKEEKESLRRIYEVLRGLAFAVSLSEKKIQVDGFAALDHAAEWAAIFARTTDRSVSRFLPPEAALSAQLAVDGPALLAKMLALDPGTKTRLVHAAAALAPRLGIDMDRDLLGNFTGRFALAFSGADPDLVALVLDPRRRGELLTHLHVIAAAELKSPATLREVLDRAAAALAKRPDGRIRFAVRAHGTNKFYELSSGQTLLLSLAVVENTLLAALGRGEMVKALERAGGREAGPHAAASGQNALARVDLARLAAELRSLDLGKLGKGAVRLKAAIDRELAPLFGQFHDLVALGRFDGQGLRLEATLRVK